MLVDRHLCFRLCWHKLTVRFSNFLHTFDRLLLANDEAAVFNISDLWVAAATREEGDPYPSAALDEDVFAEDDEDEQDDENENVDGDDQDEVGADATMEQSERDPFLEGASQAGTTTRTTRLRRDSLATRSNATGGGAMRSSIAGERYHFSPIRSASGAHRYRTGSIASSMARPIIYQSTGLARSPVTSPPALRKESSSIQRQYFDLPPSPGTINAAAGQPPALAAIPEGKTANTLLTVPGSGDSTSAAAAQSPTYARPELEKDAVQDFSIWRDLPVGLIVQYTVGVCV